MDRVMARKPRRNYRCFSGSEAIPGPLTESPKSPESPRLELTRLSAPGLCRMKSWRSPEVLKVLSRFFQQIRGFPAIGRTLGLCGGGTVHCGCKKRPTPRSGPTAGILLQFGSQNDKELSRRNDPDALKFAWKVARIAGDHVLRTPGERAFKHHVVVRIASDVDVGLRIGAKSEASNVPDLSPDLAGVESEFGPPEHLFVLSEKRFGYHERKPSRLGQIEYQGLSTPLFQEGRDHHIRVQDRFNGRHGGVPGERARSPG